MDFRAFASQTSFSQISRIRGFLGRKFLFVFSLKKKGKFLFEKKVTKMDKCVNLRRIYKKRIYIFDAKYNIY